LYRVMRPSNGNFCYKLRSNAVTNLC
jgi:hypothetical protein